MIMMNLDLAWEHCS